MVQVIMHTLNAQTGDNVVKIVFIFQRNVTFNNLYGFINIAKHVMI